MGTLVCKDQDKENFGEGYMFDSILLLLSVCRRVLVKCHQLAKKPATLNVELSAFEGKG